MIPYGRQDVTEADIDAVSDVLRSAFLTQGPAVPGFEDAVSSKVGARYAVATSSATAALHVACLALELGPGDLLWTVPNTFVASANCGRYCGADVDFVDIDRLTWNISTEKLREKLVEAKRHGRLPKVVVPVHFAGQPTDQQAIWELSQQYGFRVLEDASHAIGASRTAEPVGSCRWSDITVFSFHPVKIITTGEGGMALTNDQELAERMRMLRSHGITRDQARMRANDENGALRSESHHAAWKYEQHMLGYNYRMTDLQAALGSSQLHRLDDYVNRRNVLAKRYDDALKGTSLQLPTVLRENRSAYHLYVVRLPRAAPDLHRTVFEGLRARGIEVNVHYTPVHLQPYYRALGFKEGRCPEAEAYGQQAITLPLFAKMANADQERVIDAVLTEVGSHE